ncbi:hypothetical protein [Nocardia terpenica]|uniref:hypothetical protein n=1 Tax=Nocardia terpenica TaxID=455432 RepID=UPI000309906B|nr:hypothetical protein [Nocardia terpenica]NQE89039.1 hypothetical protein [Nocardia terpenica]
MLDLVGDVVVGFDLREVIADEDHTVCAPEHRPDAWTEVTIDDVQAEPIGSAVGVDTPENTVTC